MQNILVTGGAGFIGSNFISYYLSKYNDINIINLDSLTYAGSLNNCKNFQENPRYRFIKGDIRDKDLLLKIFNENEISGVFHFAAESHVDNSINNPAIFIETNIIGTFNLLSVAFNNWMTGPNSVKENHTKSRFHHVSTDEVYGSLGDSGLFSEKTPYAPNSPYSASKASSDMLVRSFVETYGMNCTISNCSNNYGPFQHVEKLIPTIINSAINGKTIPIYGDGMNVRDWLYVEDHCKGIDLAYNLGLMGETYNIGGKNEKTNLEIVESICTILDEILPKNAPHNKLIEFVKDRPGHDRRYAIDASKIEKSLGWRADNKFNEGIKKTIDWYIKNLT